MENLYHENNEIIGNTFLTLGYPIRFLDNVIINFESKTHDLMIVILNQNLFVLVNLSFCIEKEKVSKQLLQILKDFIKEKHVLELSGKQKKSESFFLLKEKNPYTSCKIYKGVRYYQENYIGKTKRNVITRWNGHDNPNKDLEHVKHFF